MKYITLLLLFFSIPLVSQNLIPNPSFEDEHCCPSTYSMFYCIQDWAAPTKGTTDYYSSCELKHYTPVVRTPTNFFGHQKPIHGIAYIGLYAFYHTDYREYAMTRLTDTLEAGETYRLNFWISLADTAGTAVRSIGVAFSDTVYTKRQFTNIDDIEYYSLYQSDSSFFDNKKKWIQLSLDYPAKGGETVLMIGNFQNNENTDTVSVWDKSTAWEERFDSYYYLDMVCLGLRKSDGTCACINNGLPTLLEDSSYVDLKEIAPDSSQQKKPKVGDIVILKNIHFDFDKASLRETSADELEKLCQLLIEYPSMEIVISGHTDSRGNDAYNLGLSEARALAVYTWLVQKGIDSSRLDFKGVGEQQPIASNDTDEGRQTNRRVEFEVKFIND